MSNAIADFFRRRFNAQPAAPQPTGQAPAGPLEVKLFTDIFGRTILVKAGDVRQAWSGSHFVAHFQGRPVDNDQVCNFRDDEEALCYIAAHKHLALWLHLPQRNAHP